MVLCEVYVASICLYAPVSVKLLAINVILCIFGGYFFLLFTVSLDKDQ